jgi:hypothetical protein
VRRAAASNVVGSTFTASGTTDFGGPVIQDDNVSFTMRDKSLASFLQTRSTLILAYTFAD